MTKADEPLPEEITLLDEVLLEIEKYTTIAPRIIKSKSRLRKVIYARAIAVIVLRDEMNITYKRIATLLHRTHPDVRYLYYAYQQHHEVKPIADKIKAYYAEQRPF
jgi:chromosomal replication initiation ATPase DnaA